jgi:hypothetical protein
MSTIDLHAMNEDARSSDAGGGPPSCNPLAEPVRRFERITPDDVSHRSTADAMQRAKKRQRAVGEGSESEADAESSSHTGSSAVETLAASKRGAEICIDSSDEEAEMQAEAMGGGSLWGTYNEAANAASFADSLAEWRSAGKEPGAPQANLQDGLDAEALAQAEIAAADAEFERREDEVDKIVALGITASRATAQVTMGGDVTFTRRCRFH